MWVIWRRIGPKGQVVIPKEIRDRLGLKEGVEVIVELRGNEVVIKKVSPPVEDYVNYYIATYNKKLEHEVDLKKLLEEERIERAGLRGL